MHIFFFFRGLEHFVSLYKAHLQGIYWRWDRKDKTGKETTMLVQGALRPSFLGMYEYVFPEECLSEVIAVLGINEGCNWTRDLQMDALRRMCGLKRIPKKNFKEAAKVPENIILQNSCRGLSAVRIPGVSVSVVGIKKDKRGEMYGYEQEML